MCWNNLTREIFITSRHISLCSMLSKQIDWELSISMSLAGLGELATQILLNCGLCSVLWLGKETRTINSEWIFDLLSSSSSQYILWFSAYIAHNFQFISFHFSVLHIRGFQIFIRLFEVVTFWRFLQCFGMWNKSGYMSNCTARPAMTNWTDRSIYCSENPCTRSKTFILASCTALAGENNPLN